MTVTPRDQNTPDLFHGKMENEQLQGVTDIGSITPAMMQKNTNTLAYRISRIIQLITANHQRQQRCKLSDETGLQMAKRIGVDIASADVIINLESKLEEFGVWYANNHKLESSTIKLLIWQIA